MVAGKAKLYSGFGGKKVKIKEVPSRLQDSNITFAAY